MKFFSFLPIVLLFFQPWAVAEIYKCVGESGKVEYKDSKCSETNQLEKKMDQLPKLTIQKAQVDSNKSPNHQFKGSSKNLVNNGQFLSGNDHWFLSGQDVSWSNNSGFGGSGSLVMNAPLPPNDKYIHETNAEQCVVLDGSENYVLTARLLLDKTPKRRSAHRANVVWYRTKDCSTGGTFGFYIEPRYSVGWQLMSSKPHHPTMDAVAAKIRLVQMGASSNQSIAKWDDISFKGTGVLEEKTVDPRPKRSGNLILNPGFSNDIEHWNGGREKKWSPFLGHSSGGSVSTVVRSKKSSLGMGVLNQCVLLGKNKQVDLSAYVKIDKARSSQTGGGRIRLSWYDDVNCQGQYQAGRKHADIENKTGWQHLVVETLDVPSTAKSAKVQLIQSVDGPGVFVVNWDDIYLKGK